MIIKPPPSFFPLSNSERPSNQQGAGARDRLAEPAAFAVLLDQGPVHGSGEAAIQAMLSDPGRSFPAESGGSGFASILASLMQLASMPIAQSLHEGSPSASQSAMRMAVSAYAPRYSAGEYRQKIDFGARASSTEGVAALIDPAAALNAKVHVAGPAEGQAGNPRTAQNDAPAPEIQSAGKKAAGDDSAPGFLAARFESRGQVNAIGYDRRGGTCYGIYQLSSRMGTMDEFLAYLDRKAPEWSARLREAGPANTRGRGGAMPREWKRISAEAPDRFAQLQHEFVHKQYYQPAVRAMQRRIGLEPDALSPALREVIWSTAVQHGVTGAANIFERASSRLHTLNPDSPEVRLVEKDLIEAVYAERGKRFTGSSPAVRSSVQQRFAEELQVALALVRQPEDAQV